MNSRQVAPGEARLDDAPGDVQVMPASRAQRRFWMLDQLDPDAAAYTIPVAIRLLGPLDAGVLRSALEVIVARHESLRTTFALEGESLVQVIAPPGAVDLRVEYCSAVAPDARDGLIHRRTTEWANRPFDLSAGPLFRVALLQMGAEEHVFQLVLHHIIADGSSVGILYHELEHCYASLLAGRQPALAPLPLQYADYAVWQQRLLESDSAVRQLAWWKERLAGPLPVLDLPTDRPRPAFQSNSGSKRERIIPAEVAEAVRELGRRHGATPYMSFLAAWFVFLRHYTRQDDLIVGSITAGRTRVELEPVIGLFVNTISLRVDTGGEVTYLALLDRVREATLGAMANDRVPFEEIVEALGAGRDQSRSPVFQAAFQLLEGVTADLHLSGLRSETIALTKDTAKFDLTLMLNAGPGGGLRSVLEYRSDLFNPSTIDLMLEQFGTLLGSIVAAPASPIDRLSLLNAEERATLLDVWNRTTASYPSNATIPECVTAQAGRTPDSVAVESGDRQLTFGELDRAANRVAQRLQRLGVKPGVGVGVLVARSPELIVALLGVLKAGGHYVPLAADYPADRLEFMCHDAGLRVLLASPSLPSPVGPATVLRMDPGMLEFAGESETQPVSAATPESAAYVIYTSGSTGRPKGVMVPHRAVVNYVHWMGCAFPHDTSDAVLQKAPVSFDASVWELYLPLFTGARMVLARSMDATEPSYLLGLLRQGRLTSVQFVPSQLQVLLEFGGLEQSPSLRRLFCGGEALPGELAGRIASVLPNVQVTNLYGPTETTVYSTAWTLDRGRFDGSAPIGRPIANTRVYVLDPMGALSPIGVPGELFIGGDGVASGYVGRPELTAERFVADPYSAGPEARMYRTGDLVRWRADGNLEYLRRVDHQVKLRGHRIELGEIEDALRQHEHIVAAAVTLREDVSGDRRLVAYCVSATDRSVTAAELRDHVRLRLPEIMVPAAVVLLPSLPLNANGKLDRSALPVPDASSLATPTTYYTAPRTDLERELAATWAAILGVARVGVEDDFFELGGHSLAAMRILARLHHRLPGTLTLAAILKARTVAALAVHIDSMAEVPRAVAIPLRNPSDPTPLSWSQQLVWLFEQMSPGLATYNIPMVREIEGEIDLPALQRALDGVVQRHEILRTAYRESAGKPTQVVLPPMPVELARIDLREHPDALAQARHCLEREAARPFSLEAGRLFRAVVITLTDRRHFLLLATHHIAFDGASVGILMRDLSALYAGTSFPGALPLQFGDFAAWDRSASRETAAEAGMTYWRNALHGAPGAVDLPADYPRTAAPSGPGARLVTTLPAALTARLKRLAAEHDATLFMVLLAAFQALLHRYSGQDDIVVGVPIAGRVRPETQELIGYFANTVALRARFDRTTSFAGLLPQVRETSLAAYAHQDVPYERIVLDLRGERSDTDAALFSVMFVLQDGAAPALTLGGARVSSTAVDVGAAKFDLSISAAETPEGLRLSTEYRTDVFEPATVARMVQHFGALLETAMASPECPIGELPLIDASEWYRTVREWNDTAVEVPESATIATLFEHQVVRDPNRIAVVSGAERVTYAELDQRATELASRLSALGVGPDVIVGVCLPRGVDLVVALLGVQKSGGAYVALDPAYPRERLAFMLEDTRAPVVLTTSALLPCLPDGGASVHMICLDRQADPIAPARLSTAGDTSAGGKPCAGRLAYVIYTSGSTGRPKGVAIEQRNVVAFLNWARRVFSEDELSGVLASTSASFDLSVFEMFAPLVSGGTTVVVENVLGLAGVEPSHPISLINTVPSAMTELLRVGRIPSTVRTVNLAGEPLSTTLVDALYALGHVTRVYDLYGPSETTTYSTFVLRTVSGQATIGAPIDNTRVYVLDPSGQPVAIGLPGELHIAGSGVARGYLGRPALTAERFLPEAFGGHPTGRMYKTGDLVRWRADGTLVYVGRADTQVKVRGHRIELGEIESALVSIPGVHGAVVVVSKIAENDARLVAYFVADDDGPDATVLLSELRRTLPGYMVPNFMHRLDRIPLTTNGKVDRSALPAPHTVENDSVKTLPRTPLEAQIAAVWAQVLGLGEVGIEDDFFALGGHSLLAMRVVAGLATVLPVRLTIASLFQARTVAALAGLVVQRLAVEDAAASSDEELSAMLAELERLSPGEVARLLAIDPPGPA